MLAGRYLPLLQYLAALPAEQQAATLTLGEVAAILAQPLARTAQRYPSFWTGSSVARGNWIREGWRARLNRAARTVTFTRMAP